MISHRSIKSVVPAAMVILVGFPSKTRLIRSAERMVSGVLGVWSGDG